MLEAQSITYQKAATFTEIIISYLTKNTIQAWYSMS